MKAEGKIMSFEGSSRPRSWVLVTAAAILLALGLALAPAAQARDSFAFAGTYDFGGAFGANGPTSLAVHDATETLYAVDSSNNRIVKFDISDPLAPQPADFSGLGTNEITQADGFPLSLIAASNIAIDNSSGPQDGTIYLATSLASGTGTQRAHAFSETGEWLYQFRINGDGNFDPNGANSLTALAVAVSRSGPRAGEIAVIGNNFGGDTAVFAPGPTPGDLPTLSARGTSGGILQTSGTFNAAYSSDGSQFRFIRNSFFGTGLQGGETITVAGLAYQGRFVFGDSANTGYTDVGFSNDGGRLYARSTAGGGRIDAFRQTGSFSFLTGETGSELVGQFGFGEQGSGRGMAETGTGYLYLSNTVGELRIFAPTVAPDASVQRPASLDLTTAELRGTVNAQGLTITNCEFHWGTTVAYTNPPEQCDVTPTGNGEVEVSATVSVTARTTYHAALSVTADNGTATTTPDIAWQAPEVPEAETLPAGPQQRHGTAVLGGTVDPNDTPASYYIEYSTDPGLGSSSRYPLGENVAVPAGDSPVRVDQAVPGLDNATTYYFRVVAETEAGSDSGSIMSFETFQEPSQPQPTECDNATYRTGPSASLPDCRAWEQISPQKKNNGQVAQGGTVASPNGERVAYVSGTAFDNAKSIGLVTNYMGQRGANGWTSEATAPPTSIPLTQIPYNLAIHRHTPSLLRGIGTATNVGLPGAPPSNTSAFLWDTASAENLAVAIGGPNVSGRNVVYAEIADDGTKGFVSGQRLQVAQGDEVPVGQGAVYWWTDTASGIELELASILPNGDPAITPASNDVGGTALSNDGEKILWQGANVPTRSGSRELYVSRRGQTTLWVTEAKGVPQPATTIATSVGWSPDLRFIFFSSRTQLTPDSNAQLGAEDLYRFDTDTGQLEDLTSAAPAGGGFRELFNISADGRSLYFTATGNLATGAAGSGLKLYGYRDGVIRFITDFPYELDGGEFSSGAAASREYKRAARVNNDGRYLLFPYEGSTTGTRMDSVYETNERRMYYRYDWERDRIDCVSCSPSGDPATSNAYLGMPREFRPSDIGTFGGVGRERRYMTDAGEVVFNSGQGLVSEDGNNRFDAYIWDGDLRLLTDGSSDSDQWAEEASEGFESIYVLSSKQLVRADTDGATDLYAASVGGGIAVQQVRPSSAPSECHGEACQGLGEDRPVLPRLDSSSGSRSESDPAVRCLKQRSRFRRTARSVRSARGPLQKARRVAKGSIRRYQRQPGVRSRKQVAKGRRLIHRGKVRVQRTMKVHRRSKAALIRCRGGAA